MTQALKYFHFFETQKLRLFSFPKKLSIFKEKYTHVMLLLGGFEEPALGLEGFLMETEAVCGILAPCCASHATTTVAPPPFLSGSSTGRGRYPLAIFGATFLDKFSEKIVKHQWRDTKSHWSFFLTKSKFINNKIVTAPFFSQTHECILKCHSTKYEKPNFSPFLNYKLIYGFEYCDLSLFYMVMTILPFGLSSSKTL